MYHIFSILSKMHLSRGYRAVKPC